MLKYGFSLFPDYSMQLTLAKSWQDPVVDGHVALSSPLSFLIPGLLGLTSDAAFFAWSLVVAIAAIVAPLLIGGRHVSTRSRLLIFVLVIGGPLSAVLVNWIGGYDAYIVLLICGAILTRHRWLALLCWGVLGLQHFEIALVSWVLTSVVRLARGKAQRSNLFELLAVGTGALALQGLLNALQVTSSRIDTLNYFGLPFLISRFSLNPWLIGFSALGVGWLLLVAPEIFRRKGVPSMIVISVASVFLIGPVVLDQTRVLALILLAPMLWLVSQVGVEMTSSTTVRVFRRYGVIAALMPVVVVWGGEVQQSGYGALLETFWTRFGIS